jgi:DNA-binding NtrC family response regulator
MTGRRVLVVDDEVGLAVLLARYLSRLGYETDLANTAADAWRVFQTQPASFVAVLVDQTLPDGSGEELLMQMLETNPKIGAVLSSGYPHEPRSSRIRFLQKPYPPQRLKEVLEAISPGPHVATA